MIQPKREGLRVYTHMDYYGFGWRDARKEIPQIRRRERWMGMLYGAAIAALLCFTLVAVINRLKPEPSVFEATPGLFENSMNIPAVPPKAFVFPKTEKSKPGERHERRSQKQLSAP